jgi:bifunctional non-homologous end joining protein LigD
MMATPSATLPEGDGWSYEVKWDGYRAQAVKRGGTVVLASRNLKNITKQFPTVVAAMAGVHAKDAVLDGEVVALEPAGRPSFQALHHAQTEGVSIVYYAFDLLHLNGRDLVRDPLAARRAALRTVVAGSDVLLSDALPGSARDIERAVKRLGLEGVVAKRLGSPYAAGRRSDSWVKVRFSKRQEFVIGGFKPSGANFDSIVVGYYEVPRRANAANVKRPLKQDGARRFSRATTPPLLSAGKIRNGFTPLTRAKLFAALRPLVVDRCPFANLPSSRLSHWGEGITADEMAALRWVEPILVAEISFAEWTRDGSLRHGAFLALRDDKDPRDVKREM